MKLFTFKWIRSKRERNNTLRVKLKVIDEQGRVFILSKLYREWIGICTNHIQEFQALVEKQFGGSCHYEKLCDNTLFRPTFPIFHDRLLHTGNMDYSSFPFYKVYLDRANTYEVGIFYSTTYPVAYYEESHWLTRIYLDMYYKFQCNRFYYAWYDIDTDNDLLLSSFQDWYAQDVTLPPIGIASFDLETVPWEHGSERLPNGNHPRDVITMISLVTNNTRKVFYLLPRAEMQPVDDDRFIPFVYELDMIIAFLDAINDPSILVLTGYNILSFDLPCLVARLAYHASINPKQANPYLFRFTSCKVGKYVVATFRKKLVLDMYHYITLFSNHGLTDFKLDSVASARLGEHKVHISPIAIHKWYQSRNRLPVDALKETNVDLIYDTWIDPALLLSASITKASFGSFITCLDYCLKDSILVLTLLEKENTLSFLTSRANMCTMNAEEALYFGNTKYIECVLQTYGTTLGFFVDMKPFKNIDCDDKHHLSFYAKPKDGKSQTYQGALNYGQEMSFHKNVSCYDFESLYPSVIMAFNLSPDTFTVVGTDTFNALSDAVKDECICTNYQTHSDIDFLLPEKTENILPPPHKDLPLVILYKKQVLGFIPHVLQNLRELRRVYKTRMKSCSKEYYLFNYNNQLMYKLLMNSMYGCFGSDDSIISNFAIAMSVTYFARKMLLASYHYCLSRNFNVCYCDTDSLFVINNHQLAKDITNYLGFQTFINLQLECQYRSMLIISKKKYCVRKENGVIQTKGFEKKSNPMVLQLVDDVLEKCFDSLESNNNDDDDSTGWCLLQEVLQKAWFASRVHATEYVISRKVKELEEYSPKTQAPHVRLMKRLPQFHDTSIQYSYVFTDVSTEGDREQNPRLIQEIQQGSFVNFEQLIMSQKKNLLSVLNIAYFRSRNLPLLIAECNRMIQTMRWKSIVHAALLYKHAYGEDLLLCFKKNLRYSIVT